MQREPNTEYILSLSYGKDSLACLEAIKQLGYPLDRIVHAEVWATDTIPADLPPMIDFKAHADKIIKEKYGYTVEHICAVRGVRNLPTIPNSTSGLTKDETKTESMVSLTPSERGVTVDSKLMSCSQSQEKITYEKLFYHIPKRRKKPQTAGGRNSQQVLRMDSPCSKSRGAIRDSKSQCSNKSILGFPIPRGTWCNSNLKIAAIRVSNLNRQRELVYPTQTAGFLAAPLHKGRRKILCSTSELLLMSQSELRDIPFRVKCYHS